MLKIDAHQHFWKFDPVRDSWINDDMKVIQRDFLPEHLQPVLERNGFDGCVAVQADQSEEQNTFLLDLAKENQFIKGIVGWVDLQADNIAERLDYYSQFNLIKGFRHVLQGEPQRDMMLRPAFMHGIGCLKRYDFVYDILIFPDQLKYTAAFVAAFPEQAFIIDHIAKPGIKNHDIDAWKKDITAVAQYQNVYCKLSGMVTEASWQHWKKDDFKPYLDVIVEAFGIDRILFGSDWPVCLVAGTYEEVVGLIEDYFAAFTKDEQDKIFSTNAIRFYKL